MTLALRGEDGGGAAGGEGRKEIVLRSWGCLTKYHRLSSLKQQKHILWQSGGRVQNQDESWTSLALKPAEESPSSPHLAASICRQHSAINPCRCVSLISASSFACPISVFTGKQSYWTEGSL